MRAAFCGAAVASSASVSGAASEPAALAPVRLVYDAPAGCPSAGEFAESVRGRLRRGQLSDDGSAREYRIDLRATPDRYVARLDFIELAGTRAVRELSAERCEDAASAIALVTALAIDAEVPPEPAVPPTPAASAVEPEPSAALPNPASPVPMPPPVAARPPAPSSPLELHVELGASGTLTTPKAPRVLFGVELWGGLGDIARDWFAEVAIGAERGTLFDAGPGNVRFSFYGVRGVGCAFGSGLGAGILLMPCGGIEGGVVVAEGFVGEPQTVVDPWVSLSPLARISLEAGPFVGVLEAGPTFPVTVRDDFVFGDVKDPDQEIHSVPSVGFRAALGAAWSSE